jgi:phage shock protein PspC (stress-responsive transcriptional regulator)
MAGISHHLLLDASLVCIAIVLLMFLFTQKRD